MKKIASISLLLLLAACGTKTAETKENENVSTTDEHTFDKPEKVSRDLLSFIPEGYGLMDSISGDLNLDGNTDVIIVLHKKDEEKTSDVIDHPERRPLLVLSGDGDGYALASRNDNTVLCVNCGGIMGDPFQGLSIDNKGTFTVMHYGGSAWRWTKNLTYTYSKGEKTWLLKEISEESYHNADPDKVETKTRTSRDFGKVKLADFDIYEEE